MRLGGAKWHQNSSDTNLKANICMGLFFNIPNREALINDSHSADCRSLINTLLAKSWTDHLESLDAGTSWELPVAHSKDSNHLLTTLQSLRYRKFDHSNYWTINTNVNATNCGSRNCQISNSHNWLKTNFHIGNQIIFFSIMKTVLLSNGNISIWLADGKAMSSFINWQHKLCPHEMCGKIH